MNDYIWAAYDVKDSDYNELVRSIWKRAFNNSQILEPFEDLEMRFALVFIII